LERLLKVDPEPYTVIYKNSIYRNVGLFLLQATVLKLLKVLTSGVVVHLGIYDLILV